MNRTGCLGRGVDTVEGRTRSCRRGFWVRAWWLYVLFVVYGSLVPLEFRPMALGEALERFRQIPWLRLGIEQRADWVANLVLYVPVGYGAALFLCRRWKGRAGRVLATAGALALGGLLAVAVEFAQVFVPRTVSLNDMVAEVLGTGLGAALAVGWGGRLALLWRAATVLPGVRAVRAALALYALFYAAYVLFPFDFLVNGGELAAKWAAGAVGWGVEPVEGWPYHLVLGKLLAQATATFPLGLLAGLSSRRPWTAGRALAAGCALGVGVEAAQFLLASGISQVASAGAQAVGFAAGAVACHRLRGRGVREAVWAVPPWAVRAAVVAYLAGLAVVNWAGRGAVIPLEAAAEKLRGLSFVPFYYHYYMPESRALLSALAYGGLYLPMGMFAAGGRVLAGTAGRAASGVLAASAAAFVFEAGKLFLERARPDPTNVLIAALAGWIGWHVLWWSAERFGGWVPGERGSGA